MPDVNHYIMNPGNKDKSPEVLDREQVLQGWDHDTATGIAEQENLALTDEHWKLIDYLQRYYVRYGWPQSSHELSRKLDSDFAGQGGKRYLHLLFPGGPVAQGCRIAGLPMPNNAENESMGSAQ